VFTELLVLVVQYFFSFSILYNVDLPPQKV